MAEQRLYPFSTREPHKSNQENEKQKHHVFDKTRDICDPKPQYVSKNHQML